MMQELRDFLVGQGLSADIADDVHDAYASSSERDWIDNVWRATEWMNDDEHDYTGEIQGMIQSWREQVGEGVGER